MMSNTEEQGGQCQGSISAGISEASLRSLWRQVPGRRLWKEVGRVDGMSEGTLVIASAQFSYKNCTPQVSTGAVGGGLLTVGLSLWEKV